MVVRIFSAAVACIFSAAVAAGQDATRIYIVSHGWHTGVVVPRAEIDLNVCPALRAFEDWEYVEIGWGDEGFYRGGNAISLSVALKAVASPTPTVLHVVGVAAPVEDYFATSEVVAIDLDTESFDLLCHFVGTTFQTDASQEPIDLSTGIYGTASRFFRAKGSYYFPKTCNVWTLQALAAAGLDVVPAAGIRAENVIAQSAKHGKSIRRYPGRSRIAVLAAVLCAFGMAYFLRKKKTFTLIGWGMLISAICAIAAVTLAEVNQVGLPSWLAGLAACYCWATVGLVGVAHGVSVLKRFRWRHLIATFIAMLIVIAGLSPL